MTESAAYINVNGVCSIKDYINNHIDNSYVHLNI